MFGILIVEYRYDRCKYYNPFLNGVDLEKIKKELRVNEIGKSLIEKVKGLKDQ